MQVGVFSLFGTATALDLKQAGVGLAVAVLLDATVVRAVLLPASMKLLGDWNWYLPRWLEWLPRTRQGTSTERQEDAEGVSAELVGVLSTTSVGGVRPGVSAGA